MCVGEACNYYIPRPCVLTRPHAPTPKRTHARHPPTHQAGTLPNPVPHPPHPARAAVSGGPSLHAPIHAAPAYARPPCRVRVGWRRGTQCWVAPTMGEKPWAPIMCEVCADAHACACTPMRWPCSPVLLALLALLARPHSLMQHNTKWRTEVVVR